MGDYRVALHEASHSWMALRCGWALRSASINGGLHSNGAAMYDPPQLPDGLMVPKLPLVFWPDAIRHDLERRAMVALAGEIGECLLYAQADIPLAVRAADLAADLPPGLRELDEHDENDFFLLASLMDDPDEPTDQERLAYYAYRAHGVDHMSAQSWLNHLADQVISLMTLEQWRIETLAASLFQEGQLTGEAIQAILAPQPCAST
jgi:hypothetical protein